MPKLDAFSKLMLACGLFAVATAILGNAMLEQAVAGSCAAGFSAGLGLLAVWPMLALAGGAACWAALQGAARFFAALGKRRPWGASRRAALRPGASAAVLRFPAMALRRPAGTPQRGGLAGQVVMLRPARRTPRQRPAMTPKPALEHECLGEC